MTTLTASTIVYRTSNFDAALDAAEAEGDLTADLVAGFYDEHMRLAASADVLVFDAGDDIAARMVKRPGARIIRERPVVSAA